MTEELPPNAGHFKTADAQALFERRWEPGAPPRAHLVIIHGYAEHCSRYAHVAEAFNQIGVAVHAYDQRGFGRSPGRPGYIDDFAQLTADLDAYLEHIQPRVNGAPLFLFGHSMGGLVLANYCIDRRPDTEGLLFSSPFLAVGPQVSPILVKLAAVLGKLTPWLPVLALELDAISRDPEVVAASKADPLTYHGKIHARTGAQMNAAIQRAQPRLNEITAPLYIFHGTADRLTPIEGARMLHDRAASGDKTFKTYQDGYHELFNDTIRGQVIEEFIQWTASRLEP